MTNTYKLSALDKYHDITRSKHQRTQCDVNTHGFNFIKSFTRAVSMYDISTTAAQHNTTTQVVEL